MFLFFELLYFDFKLLKMKINIITPMEIEHKKVVQAIEKLQTKKHDYLLFITGIGREAMAKAMMHLPESDCTVLIGFAAIVGEEENLPKELKFGCSVEITKASLFGYEGQQFENGKPINVSAKTLLPQLFSLTSDKFVRTTDLAEKTIINMEDYTFMYLKRKQDFIVRIISDYLPHKTDIDFFEEVKTINFDLALQTIENSL